MAPEQRAAYDAAVEQAARGEADAAAAHREHADREVARRALYGPAGDHVYGPLPSAVPQAVSVEDSLAVTRVASRCSGRLSGWRSVARPSRR